MEFSKVGPNNADFCNGLVQFINDKKAAAASVTGSQPSASASAASGSGDVTMPDNVQPFSFGVQAAQPVQQAQPQSFLGPIATLGRGRPIAASEPERRAKRSASRSATRHANKVTLDVLAEVDAALALGAAGTGTSAGTVVTAVQAPNPPPEVPAERIAVADNVGAALALDAPILGGLSGQEEINWGIYQNCG